MQRNTVAVVDEDVLEKPVGEALTRPWTVFAFGTALLCSLYYVWVAAVGIRYPQLDRSLFIFFGIALALSMKPISHNKWLRLIDVIFIVLAATATARFNVMYVDFMDMVGLPISDLDATLGLITVALSLEACRRALGWSVPVIALVFLLFLRFGYVLPAPFTHTGFDWRTIASYMYAGTDGLYSDLTYVLASQMFMFLVFGTFLMKSGASDYFADVGVSLFGHRAGGTAKASVVSSAILGSITGSAAANAAVTGSVTIPLMKAAGFRAHVAGGIEAAAATGGTVLPPVMGVAAFIMVALTGIPYSTIAIYSAIPALLYFLFVYAQVHFYARRNGLSGQPRSELPPAFSTFRTGWFYLLPVVIIVMLVHLNYSLAFTALLALMVTIAVSWLNPPLRMGPRRIVETLAEGTQHALPIMVIAGPVAVMASCLLIPGTGLRITGMILDVGQGSLASTLALIFVVAYVLGMGLSVVPAYIILATLAAPALLELKVDLLAAHLLVMWWSQASNITPPVALAVYVTSSIAQAPLWATGWAAVQKGAGLFILPVLFVYQPGFLLRGTYEEILLTLGSVIAGIVISSGALEGFFIRTLTPITRMIFGVGGAILIFGSSLSIVLLGVAVTAAGLVVSKYTAVEEGPKHLAKT